LVELGEPKGAAQPEAVRALTLSEGDGGVISVLCRRWIYGIALQQRFAANTMHFRFECTMSGPIARHERFVEQGDGAVDIARAGFRVGKDSLEEPIEDHDALLAQKVDAPAHLMEHADRRVSFSRSRSVQEDPKRPPGRQIVLARKSAGFNGIQCSARGVAARQRG
jgi:hypothetical protein